MTSPIINHPYAYELIMEAHAQILKEYPDADCFSYKEAEDCMGVYFDALTATITYDPLGIVNTPLNHTIDVLRDITMHHIRHTTPVHAMAEPSELVH